MLLKLACMAAALSSAFLWAQDTAHLTSHFVRASADAVVTAKPDRAEINIGVSTRAPTAQAASAQNAAATTQTLSAIKQTLGNGGQVKTSGYSLAPQYEYANGHPPKLSGYEAANTVMVTVDDLSLLGKIIDSATANGANNINGISFTLKDSAAVRLRALTEAAKQARENAEALARALGVQTLSLLSAEPNESPVVHPRPMAFAREAMLQKSVATPVEAGDLDIRASVTVTLEVR